MLGRLHILIRVFFVLVVLELAACVGEQQTAPPTVPRPTATPTAAGNQGPTGTPVAFDDTVPCLAEAQTETVVLSDDPDGPTGGVVGEDEGGLDEGTLEPLPKNPDAVLVDATDELDDDLTGPGGVVRDPAKPVFHYFTQSQMIGRSPVSEPNVTTDGANVLLTWNRHAAVSTDGGRTFRGMDPRSFRTGQEFCCDQLVHYIPGRHLLLWVTQTKHALGPNEIRVAATRAGQPFGESVEFTYWEWKPSHAYLPPEVWLDRPKIGNTDEHLFLAINTFDPADDFQGALVIRMPLDSIEAGIDVAGLCHRSGGAPVPIAVGTDTMYLAAPARDTSTLRFWLWPDAEERPDTTLVEDVIGGIRYGYTSGGHSCRREGLHATDWCAATDRRVMTGWLSHGVIGLAWNAAQEGPSTEYPFPYVYGLLIDQTSLRAIDHWIIRSKKAAVQYPMLMPNARGDIGGVVLYGGGAGPDPAVPDDRSGYPSCLAITRNTAGEWAAAGHASLFSDHDPGVIPELGHSRIGDYLGVWADDDMTWYGGCMTYKAAGTEIELFRFGLPGDVPG